LICRTKARVRIGDYDEQNYEITATWGCNEINPEMIKKRNQKSNRIRALVIYLPVLMIVTWKLEFATPWTRKEKGEDRIGAGVSWNVDW
jgi:hypothetical protein